ncbi:MAG TPA: SNF2-related protein [Thermomicrobiales bacterium]|nr:SNF2-related protein [Thermomicrobiales bacterium]
MVRFPGHPDQRFGADELEHHVFGKGAILRSRSVGMNGTVTRSRDVDGLTTYWMRFGDDTADRRLTEEDIELASPARDPLTLLRTSAPGDHRAFALGLRARQLLYAYSSDDLVSLSNARIELLPHQVFVAHRVLQRTPPRFLLADEVGLGKTIETGLIIKEMRARGAASRVLVIAPSGLVPQWMSELSQKFNEQFTRIDSITLPGLLAQATPEQVWSDHPLIVTSLHLLRAHPDYVDLLAEESWDLIVFDEAHHLRKSRRGGESDDVQTTEAYRLAEQLRASTDALLLLTATPLQIHPSELHSLLDLLDPTLFPSYHEFERYRRQIPILNDLTHRIDTFDALAPDEQAELAQSIHGVLSETVRTRTLEPSLILAALQSGGAERQGIVDLVADRHLLSSVMIRNRKRNVFDNMQPRQAKVLHLAYSDEERLAYDEVTRYIEHAYDIATQRRDQALGFVMVTYRKMLTSSAQTLRQSLERRVTRLEAIRLVHNMVHRKTRLAFEAESDGDELDGLLQKYESTVHEIDPAGIDLEIRELRRLCQLLGQVKTETKATRLQEMLAGVLSDPQEKVLIFTQFAATMTWLGEQLRDLYRVVTFSGSMSPQDKDRTIDQFRDPAGAQVMIATEAAGEGRNLQFCHVMVNYDLPWNPMKVEQRIGRLDRIGQTHPVEIYNFAVEDTLEDRILTRLLERIGIFESTIGYLDPILGTSERDFETLMLRRRQDDPAPEVTLDREVERVTEQVRRAQAMEHQLEDFILDRRSFRKDQADVLLNRKPRYGPDDIRHFIGQLFPLLGGAVTEVRDGIVEVRTPARLQLDGSGGLRSGYRATFDPAVALRQDQLDFIAFGHDVLDASIRHCTQPAFGGQATCVQIVADSVPAGIAYCGVYEEQLTGVQPRTDLRFVVVDTAGRLIPSLCEHLPDLLADGEIWPSLAAEQAFLESVLDDCHDAAEEEAFNLMQEEVARREPANEVAFGQEVEKRERFYAIRLATEDRVISRLRDTLKAQRASANANDRRVVPATQGRLDGAVRRREALLDEQAAGRRELDRAQRVTSSNRLLAAGWVKIVPGEGRR